jgi:membrane fusion protein (multidrug efflux system)
MLVPRVACIAAAMLVVACGRGPQAQGPGGPGGGAPPPMPVQVLEVVPQKVPVTIETVGTLEGLREVEVRARVGGTLTQQLYREGEPVKAGAVLYRIDRTPLQITLDAARAAEAQALARVEQARRENQRLAPLVAERAISQREADDAGSALKAAEAAVLAARAQVREAQLNLGYADVTAPVAGVAQRSQRSVGSLVAPTADGAVLTTIVQIDPIRVRFALAEAEVAQLTAGRGREVRIVGGDGSVSGVAGRLDFTGSTVDPRLGTVPMRAELPNAGRQWLPGQFVRVRLVAGEHDAFLVPQAAVQSGDQGRFVWVIGADGKAAPKPVQAGTWQGGDWVIRSGLAAGDRVITSNLLKLRPGAPVQPEAPAPAVAASAAAATAVPASGPASAAASGARAN